jgi:hypothetical protein
MLSRTVALGLLLLSVFVLVPGHGNTTPSSKESLEGVWQPVGDQSGLVLFTGGYYSWMVVSQPRELFSDPGNPTDAEWLAACRGIIANSGSYQVSGSALRLHIKVAKHPNAMAVEQIATFEYAIEADTLRVNPGTDREMVFTRLE